MTLVNKLKIPVMVAGLGLAGIAGCGKEEKDISEIKLNVMKEKRLTEDALDWLAKRDVPRNSALAYSERFLVDIEEIPRLYNNGTMPGVANSYDETIFDNGDKIINADDAGLDNKTALEYDSRFSALDRIDLYANNVLPEIANPYHRIFSSDDIIALHKREGIDSKTANNYARLNKIYGVRIGADDIIGFVQKKVSYEVVEKRAKELMVDKSIVE